MQAIYVWPKSREIPTISQKSRYPHFLLLINPISLHDSTYVGSPEGIANFFPDILCSPFGSFTNGFITAQKEIRQTHKMIISKSMVGWSLNPRRYALKVID